MLKKYYTAWLSLLLLTLAACEKMETRKPMSPGEGKPGSVKDITIQNGKGSAVITYSLPKEADIQYVMAEYYVNAELKRTVKVSRYDNKLTVDGFNDKGLYDVTLYAVNVGEVKSDPVTVKVDVDTPPFREVFAGLTMIEDFGGVNVRFQNPFGKNIAIVVITADRNNDVVPAETFYTTAKSGSYSARGFLPEMRRFGVYVRDQFNNYSDTLYKDLVPFKEELLDKNKFRTYDLPGDMPSDYGWVVSNLWDNNNNTGYHSPEPVDIPGTITFDLGVTANLSRFRFFQRSGLYYQWGNPRKWIMWGSNNPNPDGSFSGWTKLMECESYKPSGSPQGTNTIEDINYITPGEEFTLPLDAPASRYIRVQFLESWSGSPRIHLMEATFWGNIQ